MLITPTPNLAQINITSISFLTLPLNLRVFESTLENHLANDNSHAKSYALMVHAE